MRRFNFTQRDRFDDDGDVDNDYDNYDDNEEDDEGKYVARVNTDENDDDNVYCYNDDFFNDDNCYTLSPRRPNEEYKRMVLEHTHGLFIT